jgi:hypothetical protein
MTPLELDGEFLSETGMAPRGVVPAFDELEDRNARPGLRRKRRGSSSSHSRVAKKLAHIVLS